MLSIQRPLALAALLSTFVCATAQAAAPFACPNNVASLACPAVAALLSQREGFGRNATGGLGGQLVLVTSPADSGSGTLREAVENATGPTWIVFDGPMQITLLSQIRLPAHITVDGRGHDIQVRRRGFISENGRNVILAYLSLDGEADPASIDGVSIATASDIWLHHLSLRRFSDGLIDIKDRASNVTVSWSHLSSHNKVMIIGTNPTPGADLFANHAELTKVSVTLHHNVFVDTTQRNPRLVMSKLHAYNNLYKNWLSYGISASLEAQARIENNVFEIGTERTDIVASATKKAILIDADLSQFNAGDVTYHYRDRGFDSKGFVAASGNLYLGRALEQPVTYLPEKVFRPGYCYTLDVANGSLATNLLSTAGHLAGVEHSEAKAQVCPSSNPLITSYGATVSGQAGWQHFTVTENAGNTSHQASVYFDRLPGAPDAFVLSFTARFANANKALTFGLSNSELTQNYVSISINPNGNSVIRSLAAGAATLETPEVAWEPDGLTAHVRLRGTIPAAKLRINARLQLYTDRLIDVSAGDPANAVAFSHVRLEEPQALGEPVLWAWRTFADTETTLTSTNGVMTLAETGTSGYHGILSYFHAFASDSWGIEFDFAASPGRYPAVYLGNADNLGAYIFVRCEESAATVTVPQNPGEKEVVASVTSNGDGTFRCSVRGKPDPLGGNKLRVDIRMHKTATHSHNYAGEGPAVTMTLRNVKLLKP